MKKIISIDGMMCNHCEKTVKDALSKVGEVIEVSHKKNVAIIDTDLNNKKLTEIIEDLGFEVTDINEW